MEQTTWFVKAGVAVLLGSAISSTGLFLVDRYTAVPGSAVFESEQAADALVDETPDPIQQSREALAAIDALAMHPADPQRSSGLLGVSDEVLAAADPVEVGAVIASTLGPARASHSPRHLFALGRAALAQGDEDLAWDLLSEAADRGSAAAHGYLAHLTDGVDETKDHLQQAVSGGFEPAAAWLEEVEAIEQEQEQEQEEALAASEPEEESWDEPEPPQQPFDPNVFNRPDLITALHIGNMPYLNQNLLESTVYVSTLHQTWTDTQVLFMVDDRNILLEVDATVGQYAARKLTTSTRGLQQTVDAGMGSFWKMLTTMAEVRRNGGTVMDEVQATQKALYNSPLAKLDILRTQATQDARRLAMLYDTDPDAFRQVYKGIRQYVAS